jgi:site-specific DNA-methyltransferase (adenine-specific)
MNLILGDCLDKLKELDDNSVDSIVTDPPYGLSFMGKKWDYDVPSQAIWEECMRVLKPGGHLLAFAGSRTYHRMAVRIEDAGFEIRDQIMWVYGSGFPKSHNIGKGVDKLQGNEREVVGENPNKKGRKSDGKVSFVSDTLLGKGENAGVYVDKGNSQWEGWGTALKPAHEPIVMARKPLSENTVVDNVLQWGTGGINIDDSRIGLDEELDKSQLRTINRSQKTEKDGWGMNSNGSDTAQVVRPEGRFPANIIFDEEAGKLLDEQSGISKSTGGRNGNKEGVGHNGIYGKYNGEVKDGNPGLGDVGGASRFFYCPKTSKTDRNEGLDEFEEKTRSDMNKMMGKSGNFKTGSGNDRTTEFKNHHPTVKPTDLMLYLIRLVTPKGGTTLDPFMGSGSTGKAAVRGGFDFVGIEREKDYFQIAEARIQYEIDNPYIEGKDERIQLNKTAKNFW